MEGWKSYLFFHSSSPPFSFLARLWVLVLRLEDERLILPIHKPSAGVRLNKIGGLEDASIHSSIFQPSFSCLVYLIQNVNEFVLTEKKVILPFSSLLLCLKRLDLTK